MMASWGRIRTIAGIVWLQMIRRKDLYVLLILMIALLCTLVSVDAFGLAGATAYVMDIGPLFAWVFGWILAVAVAGRELPGEESRGTIFALLAKPVTRWDVVVGKWLGAWTIVSVATLMFYLLVFAVAALKGGHFQIVSVCQGYMLHAGVLSIITAIALLFSTRMNSDAAISLSSAITAASFAVVPKIPAFLVGEVGWRPAAMLVLYHVLPHFEVFDIRVRLAQDYGAAPWLDVWLALGYAAAMTVAVIVLAWISYRGRRFSRSSLANG